jgi:hypothetical protein
MFDACMKAPLWEDTEVPAKWFMRLSEHRALVCHTMGVVVYW